jgi:hypothetical protein
MERIKQIIDDIIQTIYTLAPEDSSNRGNTFKTIQERFVNYGQNHWNLTRKEITGTENICYAANFRAEGIITRGSAGAGGSAGGAENEITNENLHSALLTRENTLQIIANKVKTNTNNLPNNLELLSNIGAHLDAMAIVAQKLFYKSNQSNNKQNLMKLINISRKKLDEKFNILNKKNRRRTRKRNQRRRKTRKV